MVVLMKYNMEKNYCNPYELCLWEGVFDFFLYSICLAIFCGLKLSLYGITHPDNLIQYFKEFGYNDLLLFLAEIITGFTYNISIFLTCDYFTPIHILIIPIIIETKKLLILDSNWTSNIISILILIIILFMLLVFIEVIEINICNLSYNTKKNINLRSEKDSFFDVDSIIFPEDEPELNEVGEVDGVSTNSIYG